MAAIDDLVGRVSDPGLRQELARAVAKLKEEKRFGLVFEEHLPETVALPRLPVRVGNRVVTRRNTGGGGYLVHEILPNGDACLTPEDGGEATVLPVADLMAVSRFGEPIYPVLTPLGTVERGPKDRPHHAVINGENYHALQLLNYLYRGQVDCVYLDPPYNTGAKDWKYNNRFVDENDVWRHSKWLSMMERRLTLVKTLLKPDGVLIVTIDENERDHLGLLLEKVFPESRRQVVSICINPSGVSGEGLSRVDEYAFFSFLGDAMPAMVRDDNLSPLASKDEGDQMGTKVAWESLLRRGNVWYRAERKNLCYGILIDPQTQRIVNVLPPLSDEQAEDPPSEHEGYQIAYPIRSDLKLGVWRVEGRQLMALVKEGFAYATSYDPTRATWAFRYLMSGTVAAIRRGEIQVEGTGPRGEAILRNDNQKKVVAKTIWHRGRHTAGGSGGTQLLTALLASRGAFPYPKSVYAVQDSLEIALGDKPDALVVDVFGGSGTTVHATCLLNRLDNGRRRCVLVSNNEVGEEADKRLRDRELGPGDHEYEARGIYEAVTMPRIKASITGKQPDGTDAEGDYLDGLPYAQGLDENAAFFRLDYLDPDQIEVGRGLGLILPALWLAAGGVGSPGAVDENAPWTMPEGSTFAVLMDEGRFREFREALAGRPDVTHVWFDPLGGRVRGDAGAPARRAENGDACAGLPAQLPHRRRGVKIELKAFQEAAVDDLLRGLRRAMRDAHEEPQTLTLAAPTGSGKTVMATAAIERILEGEDGAAPNPQARFLWVTDQPELNLQTLRKMKETSSVLDDLNLVVMDETFDRDELLPGAVHFLNLQKLHDRNSFATGGTDRRTHGFWDTLSTTAARYPNAFITILDEAHRGAKPGQERKSAQTYMRRLVLGHEGFPPLPIVLGVSATLRRFQEMVQDARRVTRTPVEVPAEEVRASGLLKDAIVLGYPDEAGAAADLTLLREAVASWRGFETGWRDHAAREGETPVRPLLLVQVEDRSEEKGKGTDLDAVVRAVDEAAPGLPDAAFAHAFQDGGKLTANGRTIRYLEPSRIDGDPDVRVTLFKTSLNTGWDCPRAETMMSFRRAVDATLIAQLIGRMVRTPLARRVESDDALNKVALYLPYWDRAGVQSIVRQLQEDDETRTPVEVVDARDLVTLARATGTEAAFAALANVPNWTVPGVRKVAASKRLMKFGRALADDGLRPNGLAEAKDTILGTLDAALARLSGENLFQEQLARRANLKVRTAEFNVGDPTERRSDTVEVPLSPENVEELFEGVGRKIGNGLHLDWRRRREDAGGVAPAQARLEAVLLIENPVVRMEIEEACKARLGEWARAHKADRRALPEERRAAYDEIDGLAPDPVETDWNLPARIDAKGGGESLQGHLYALEDGTAPMKLGTWERATIREELARGDVVGWLRNVDRKDWAYRIPYRSEGKHKPLYPDFVVVRQGPRGLEVDILDPHDPELPDAVDKALGLVEFARKHGAHFGRIEMIALDGNDLVRRLDLTDEATWEKVGRVTSSGHLVALFDEA